MPYPRRIDLIGLLTGIAAVPFAAITVHLRSTLVPGSGNVLTWLDRLGLVIHSSPPSPSVIQFDLPAKNYLEANHEKVTGVIGSPEISEAGILALNDDKALMMLLAISVVLALTSIASAIWSEKQRRPTLYLSVGFVCGVLGIAQIWFIAGLVAAVSGAVAVLVLRSQYDR